MEALYDQAALWRSRSRLDHKFMLWTIWSLSSILDRHSLVQDNTPYAQRCACHHHAIAIAALLVTPRASVYGAKSSRKRSKESAADRLWLRGVR